MLARRSDLITGVGVVTARAGIGGETILNAGGLGHNSHIIVAQGRDLIIGIAVLADSAGVGGVAGLGAGRIRHDRLVVMARRRVKLAQALLGNHFLAHRALHHGLAGFRAGRRNILGITSSVACRRGYFFLCLVTAATSVDVRASLRAGRCNARILIQLPVMAQRFAEFLVLAVDRAADSTNGTNLRGLRAGGVNVTIIPVVFAGRRDFFRNLFATSGASVSPRPSSTTSGGHLNHRFRIRRMRCRGIIIIVIPAGTYILRNTGCSTCGLFQYCYSVVLMHMLRIRIRVRRHHHEGERHAYHKEVRKNSSQLHVLSSMKINCFT